MKTLGGLTIKNLSRTFSPVSSISPSRKRSYPSTYTTHTASQSTKKRSTPNHLPTNYIGNLTNPDLMQRRTLSLG